MQYLKTCNENTYINPTAIASVTYRTKLITKKITAESGIEEEKPWREMEYADVTLTNGSKYTVTDDALNQLKTTVEINGLRQGFQI